jgi:hypothetical protein
MIQSFQSVKQNEPLFSQKSQVSLPKNCKLVRGRQSLESLLRKRTNIFFGLLAEGDNQCLDGGKLKVIVQVDTNNITEHDPNRCNHANPTIVIIFWRLLGQNIHHLQSERWECFGANQTTLQFCSKGRIPIHLNYTLPIHQFAMCVTKCQIQKPQKSMRNFGIS